MNKSILVTGSSRGLGLSIAQDLSFKGFSIVLNARDESSLKYALDTLNKDITHHVFCCDLIQEDAVEILDEFLKEKNIKIEGIVHNLGGKVQNDVQPLHVNTLRKSMRLNLEVAIELNNYFIPLFKKYGSGKIVHIGSSSGYSGNAAPAYAISKGALNTYIKNSARYYAKDEILICGILPGILDHEGSEWDKKSMQEPEKYESRKKAMPLKRFAKPQEIAPYVSSIFQINSMQATGSIISLEGGI